MERILISAGVVLSLLGVWLMIEATIRRDKNIGRAENIGGAYHSKKYKLGWICLIVGAIAQVVGIWLSQTISVSWEIKLDWYLLPALFTGLAAGAAWLSARATSKNTQAQLYIRLMEEYGSQEMSDALRGIKEFSEKPSVPSALSYLRNILPDAQKVQDDATLRSQYYFCTDTVCMALEKQPKYDSYRRIVKYYFLKVLRLYENGFLSEKRMKELGKVAGIDLFYDVIQPIEFAFNKDFNFSNFNIIQQICGRYDEEKRGPNPHS